MYFPNLQAFPGTPTLKQTLKDKLMFYSSENIIIFHICSNDTKCAFSYSKS